MRHLDLFSGIGGFALAAERVWPGIEHTFCDIEPFSQEVLKKHWPEATVYTDIRTLTKKQLLADADSEKHGGVAKQPRQEVSRAWPVHILTGGFPCQPFSQAGRRRGTEDDRHLWPEMLRVIREFHPRWVVGENVDGFVTWNEGMVLEQVHTDLEGEGYEVQAFIVPAVAVNAPHRRYRVWIVAHSTSERIGGSTSEKRRVQERLVEQSERKGDSVRGESEGRAGISHTDTVSSRLQRGRKEWQGQCGQFDRDGSNERRSWNQNWLEVATRLCRMDDGLPRRLDRNPRLKALGNAIVPQVAEEIMRAIKAVDV